MSCEAQHSEAQLFVSGCVMAVLDLHGPDEDPETQGRKRICQHHKSGEWENKIQS